ncbi:MAG: hypothetical protein H7345_03350 [Rubritepida sp.]|nr:hypothetical protein [Rubritepida sp.]
MLGFVGAAGSAGGRLGALVAQVRRAAVNQKDMVMLVAGGIYRGDIVRTDIRLATRGG